MTETTVLVILYFIAGIIVSFIANLYYEDLLDAVELGILALVWPLLGVVGLLGILGRLIKFFTRIIK